MLNLSACSTTNHVNAFMPQSAEPDKAMVYIYRPTVMANAAYSPDLYINDEFMLSIKIGKKTPLTLTPGETKIEIEPDSNYSGVTSLNINLIAGSTYFIRVDTSLKVPNAIKYEPYKRGFYLVKVDEQLAIKEITDCCVSNSKKTTTASETKPVKEETDGGFSVDKTQNPFSH